MYNHSKLKCAAAGVHSTTYTDEIRAIQELGGKMESIMFFISVLGPYYYRCYEVETYDDKVNEIVQRYPDKAIGLGMEVLDFIDSELIDLNYRRITHEEAWEILPDLQPPDGYERKITVFEIVFSRDLLPDPPWIKRTSS